MSWRSWSEETFDSERRPGSFMPQRARAMEELEVIAAITQSAATATRSLLQYHDNKAAQLRKFVGAWELRHTGTWLSSITGILTEQISGPDWKMLVL